MKTHIKVTALAIATLTFGMAAASAQAQTATTSAQDLSIHVSLLGLANLDVTPQIPAQITAAVSATVDQHTLPGFADGGSLVQVSTGVLTTYAEYDPGAISAAGGTVSVANLDLSAVSLLGASLLSVSAEVIQSTAIVSGYCLPQQHGPQTAGMFDDFIFASTFDSGNLGSGLPGEHNDDVTLGGLQISILGIAVPELPLNPPPNTTIGLPDLGIAGATLVLNEQTVSGDGVNNIAKTSNAVHLSVNVAGLITAEVVIAHADASLSCSS